MQPQYPGLLVVVDIQFVIISTFRYSSQWVICYITVCLGISPTSAIALRILKSDGNATRGGPLGDPTILVQRVKHDVLIVTELAVCICKNVTI